MDPFSPHPEGSRDMPRDPIRAYQQAVRNFDYVQRLYGSHWGAALEVLRDFKKLAEGYRFADGHLIHKKSGKKLPFPTSAENQEWKERLEAAFRTMVISWDAFRPEDRMAVMCPTEVVEADF